MPLPPPVITTTLPARSNRGFVAVIAPRFTRGLLAQTNRLRAIRLSSTQYRLTMATGHSIRTRKRCGGETHETSRVHRRAGTGAGRGARRRQARLGLPGDREGAAAL